MTQEDNKKKEENVFKQAWHSVGDALHLRSEDVPPPVPPKDERWLVKTVNKSPLPQEDQTDPGFWNKLFHKNKKQQQNPDADDSDDDEWVPISVPADAALEQMGIQGDDEDLEEKKNYFERMAARVKEKFDEDDDDDSDSDSDSDDDDETKSAKKAAKQPKSEEQKLESKQRKKLTPKVDPKEMREAHKALYGTSSTEDDNAEEEADKKMFGSWWGCHPRRSRAERKLAKQQEAEREQARILAELEAKRKAEEEAAEAARKAAQRKWWQLKAETPEQKAEKAKKKERKERKSTSRKHQAIAAAAAYEAMKKYQDKQEKDGKKVSHGEMKAVLAGMAMAEAVKLLDSRHDDDDDDDDDKDDTVAEAGSKALKLFELLR